MTIALTDAWLRPDDAASPTLPSATSAFPMEPIDLHRRLPGYAPTPLRDLPALALDIGVGRLLVKDEASRMGLPAFKVLGASWAIYRALSARWPDLGHDWATIDDLRARIANRKPITFAAATDGNHGRAVAHIARLLGTTATIVVPANMVPARIAAIEAEGATIERVSGGYGEAVARSAALASATCEVISDTSWPGYEAVPRWVIDGYGTMFAEISAQAPEPPTHVLVPVGVGALAAAALAAAATMTPRPRVIGVEPDAADCVLRSLRAGTPITLPGEQGSIMAGLNCDTPSPVAWDALRAGLDVVLSIPDDAARTAMRVLADHGVVAGETGAAALAGLLALAGSPLWDELGLGDNAVVLALMTEGATDPAAWQTITGRPLPPIG